jgi:hypothetical protein
MCLCLYVFHSLCDGLPITVAHGGRSSFTTALRPNMAPSPTVTPERIATPSVIHTLLSIEKGPLEYVQNLKNASGIQARLVPDWPNHGLKRIRCCSFVQLNMLHSICAFPSFGTKKRRIGTVEQTRNIFQEHINVFAKCFLVNIIR